MYIDGAILFGLLSVISTCAIAVYLGWYTWKQINLDVKKEDERNREIDP